VPSLHSSSIFTRLSTTKHRYSRRRSSTTASILCQTSSRSFPNAVAMQFCRSIRLHHRSAPLSSVIPLVSTCYYNAFLPLDLPPSLFRCSIKRRAPCVAFVLFCCSFLRAIALVTRFRQAIVLAFLHATFLP